MLWTKANKLFTNLLTTFVLSLCLKLEIRSVERGICPIVSVHNERTVPIIMTGCMAHALNGYISTSELKSDVTIVFLDPDFLNVAKITAIRVHLRQI